MGNCEWWNGAGRGSYYAKASSLKTRRSHFNTFDSATRYPCSYSSQGLTSLPISSLLSGSGAGRGTRTPTGYPIRPSNVRVCRSAIPALRGCKRIKLTICQRRFWSETRSEEAGVPPVVRKRWPPTTQPKTTWPFGESRLWVIAVLLLLSIPQGVWFRRRALH